MKLIDDEMVLFQQLLKLISTHFGPTCEVVLHDLTKGYDHTIADIRNGHITNRAPGDCGSNLGLEILRGSIIDGDRFNYITNTSDGKILRSSSIYIKDDAGKVIGSICINSDITETIKMENYLKQINHYEFNEDEVFVKDVNNLLDYLLQQAQTLVGKPFSEMDKKDKISALEYLDQKGAFLITKSNEKVCSVMGISKFTLYNYLDSIREEKKQ